VLDDKPTRTPGEEGRRDLAIIEALYKSAETGKVTEVKA